ncbi:phosphoprotein [Boteke virus]|uniref:Phosphoprotein n=1 Tax=Boteke virus TaxID=864698 RepID=A0AAE8XBJ8_9RHAB|nr:phosphoprotein [Boteke virus]UAU42840.1 phosphoprotein [Boteke virus]
MLSSNQIEKITKIQEVIQNEPDTTDEYIGDIEQMQRPELSRKGSWEPLLELEDLGDSSSLRSNREISKPLPWDSESDANNAFVDPGREESGNSNNEGNSDSDTGRFEKTLREVHSSGYRAGIRDILDQLNNFYIKGVIKERYDYIDGILEIKKMRDHSSDEEMIKSEKKRRSRNRKNSNTSSTSLEKDYKVKSSGENTLSYQEFLIKADAGIHVFKNGIPKYVDLEDFSASKLKANELNNLTLDEWLACLK